jgi:hypothetical protein
MPYGKGTYGSKVGRPPKKDVMNPRMRAAAKKRMRKMKGKRPPLEP